MFSPFGDINQGPLGDLEPINMALRDVYFFRGEEFVAKRQLVRTVTEYAEAQEAFPDCLMWMKISDTAPWQYYYKGERFNHFRLPRDQIKEPAALSMMELVGAL